MSKKVTLLEKLLDKASEAIGIRKKELQKKLIERSLDKAFDNIEGRKIDAETKKLSYLEQLATISDEKQGVEIFKRLAEQQQELIDCKNTIDVLTIVKDELYAEPEGEE